MFSVFFIVVKNALNTLNLINHTLKDFVEKPNKK